MMLLTEQALSHKIWIITSHQNPASNSGSRLQVQIRRARATSTAWSATTTARTPTRWWRTGGSTRSSTPSWPRASRSSPPRSTAPPRAAATTASRPTTTAGEGALVFPKSQFFCLLCQIFKFLSVLCPFFVTFLIHYSIKDEDLKVGRFRD